MKLGKTKLIGIVAFVALVVGASFGILLVASFNKEASFEDDISESKRIVQENALSMMIEQPAGAGDYKLETRTSWPTDGYKFNATLSKCENGGELGWDETKGVVTMTGNMSDRCFVYFDKYSYGVVNSFTYTATTSSLTITASATKGENEISKYYFSIDDGSTYNESSTNTYTFSSLSAGTPYTVMIKTKDSLNKEGSVYSDIATTKSTTIAEVCSSMTYLATCLKNYAETGSTNSKIYHHDGTLANGINDGSYRYAGASSEVNNYVFFGCDSTCSTDNLYRIIGVFEDEYGNSLVKLIKADYANSNLLGTNGAYSGESSLLSTYSTYIGSLTEIDEYIWGSNNTWSNSNLNLDNLNINFLSNIGSSWRSMIINTTWKIGGNTWKNIVPVTPLNAYKNEIVEPNADNSDDGLTEDYAEVGLMYITDYEFAASQSAWTLPGTEPDSTNSDGCYGCTKDYRAATNINWMYLGFLEMTITRSSNNNSGFYSIDYNGGLTINYISQAVRPVFYLHPDVKYLYGSGTSSDPIMLLVG